MVYPKKHGKSIHASLTLCFRGELRAKGIDDGRTGVRLRESKAFPEHEHEHDYEDGK